MAEKNVHLNIIREKILMKGFATITDIRKFIPCGQERAHEIYSEEKKLINRKNDYLWKGISSKSLLKYIDLTADEIKEYAEREKRNSVPSKQNSVEGKE